MHVCMPVNMHAFIVRMFIVLVKVLAIHELAAVVSINFQAVIAEDTSLHSRVAAISPILYRLHNCQHV